MKHNAVSLSVPQVASPAALGPHMRFQPESAARIASRVISCCHWYEMTRQSKQDAAGTCYPGRLCRMRQAMPLSVQAGGPYLVSGRRPDRHPIQGACSLPICLSDAARARACRVHPALDRVPMLLLVLTTSLTLHSMTSKAWRGARADRELMLSAPGRGAGPPLTAGRREGSGGRGRAGRD
jgi:hypothetical protein